MKLDSSLIEITQGHTLFLDRDGVINYEKKEDYILSWNEFNFMDGVLEAFENLNTFFQSIVIVTNQRCIGKGLLTHEELGLIHHNMLQQIINVGGRVDAIYYCADDDNLSPNRKPNAGMAFQAINDIPTIQLDKAIMVGNRLSDMQFARNAGMQSVYLTTTHPEVIFPNPLIDYRFDSLLSFSKAIIKS